MTSAGTWWRTICHLRLQQIVGRIRFRLARPRIDRRPAPLARSVAGLWVEPARRQPSLDADLTFTFLNERHRLADIGWNNERLTKLWLYNLHYFDDLGAYGAAQRVALHRNVVTQWIAENPPAVGNGWEPYPTSLRIVNWIKWALTSGVPLERAWRDSLAVQARWLASRLEWHLLGNHLFANAKALMFAGLYFEGTEAERWRTTAARILTAEMREQILPDGGQFELSPMYHALALEDVLDLVNIARALPGIDPDLHRMLSSAAPRMLWWARCMSFEDGSPTHFNDSAAGIAPALDELDRYAALLGIVADRPSTPSTVHLPNSGYVRVANGPAVMWIDAAAVGPTYIPGHAHADTLSFEMSIGGRPVIVNGGTSTYAVGAQRLRERGTAWHNTVQIGSVDSSEVWSAFRVGRRAYPRDVIVRDNQVSASHDGYRFLPGSPLHHRSWQLSEHSLVVTDQIEPKVANAIARFHLAPGLSATRSDRGWDIGDGSKRVASVTIEGGDVGCEAAEHAPAFGKRLPAMTLHCAMPHGWCRSVWTWNS